MSESTGRGTLCVVPDMFAAELGQNRITDGRLRSRAVIVLSDLVTRHCLDVVWENERTPTPVRVFGVRLHSMGLSVREVVAVLDLRGVDRSHGTVWNWTHDLAESQADPPMAAPSRVAVDEKQIKVDGEKNWLYAAIDTESKLLLEIDVHSRRGIGPAAAFLHRLTEKHDVSDTEFLVDGGGYLTALFRHDLSGQRNYTDRNHIEKWFQTVSMRIDRFHSFWRGNPASTRRWLRRFRHHYNHDRPN